MVGQVDSQLFVALTRVAGWRLGHFNEQNLANTAWAFATAGEPTPALLDPILVLDMLEVKDTKPQVMLLASAAAE